MREWSSIKSSTEETEHVEVHDSHNPFRFTLHDSTHVDGMRS